MIKTPRQRLATRKMAHFPAPRLLTASTLFVLFVGGIVLSGMFAFSGCGKKEEPVHPKTKNACDTLAQVFNIRKRFFEQTQQLPAELLPYETVEIFPKVEGYIEHVYVDRGSFVKKGQVLTTLIAPELESRIAEAESQVQTATEQLNETKTQHQSDKAVYERILKASKTAGAIAENELEVSYLRAKASHTRVLALMKNVRAHQHALMALKKVNNYLTIRAPIDGVVTTRNLHPGALVGPSGAGADEPIFKIDQLSHLRLVLPVPERYYSSVQIGDIFRFTVPAYPGTEFTAKVRRPSYALNTQYRTEYVELDYFNKGQTLTPGMFAQVNWDVRRKAPTFVVPSEAIAQTSERMFVIRVEQGTAHWVDIQRGFTDGKQVEVFGNLEEGDSLILKASDEIADGGCVAIPANPK